MVNRILRYLSDVQARIQFWYARKKIVFDRDIKIFDTEDATSIAIEIISGKYAGTAFTFEAIKVGGDDDNPMLSFDTVLLKNPKKFDINDKGLLKYIGDVMRIILHDAVKERASNDSRNNDIDEPHEEREVYEESSTVSEARVSPRTTRKKIVDSDSEVHPTIQQPTKRASNTALARRRTKSDRTRV